MIKQQRQQKQNVCLNSNTTNQVQGRPNLCKEAMKKVTKKYQVENHRNQKNIKRKVTTPEDDLKRHLFRECKEQRCSDNQKNGEKQKKSEQSSKLLINQIQDQLKQKCLNKNECDQKKEQKKQNCQQEKICDEQRCQKDGEKCETEQKTCLGGTGKMLNKKRQTNKKVQQDKKPKEGKKQQMINKNTKETKILKQKKQGGKKQESEDNLKAETKQKMKAVFEELGCFKQNDDLKCEVRQKMKAVFEELKGLGLEKGKKILPSVQKCQNQKPKYSLVIIPEEELARTWKQEQFKKLDNIVEKNEKNLIVKGVGLTRSSQKLGLSRLSNKQSIKKQKQPKCSKQEIKENTSMIVEATRNKAKTSNMTMSMVNKTEQKPKQRRRINPQINICQKSQCQKKCEQSKKCLQSCEQTQKCEQRCKQSKKCEQTKKCLQKCGQDKNCEKKQLKNVKSPKGKQIKIKSGQQNRNLAQKSQKSGLGGAKNNQKTPKIDVKQHRRSNARMPLGDGSSNANWK